MKEIIYISGPYTHPNILVCDEREIMLTQAAAIFAKRGHIVYSPITHSAPLARMGVELTHEEWIAFDRPFMELCTRCVVVMLDGWIESQGVDTEIDYFNKARKFVLYAMPHEIENLAKRWAEQ